MRYTRVESARTRSDGRWFAAFVLALGATCALAVASPAQEVAAEPRAIYVAGKGVEIAGVIISKQGDELLVRDPSSKLVSVVTVTNGTKITSHGGFLGLDHKGRDRSALLPGLIISVNGTGTEHGTLVARKIGFKRSAQRVATQISGGEVDLKARERATAAQASANAEDINRATARAREARDSLDASIARVNTRISEIDAYDPMETATVNFATGSAVLSPAAKATLAGIADRGKRLNGYLIEVSGFADVTGSAALNQRLSQQRANAVVAYLTESESIPIRRISVPVGLSTTRPVATNATSSGRAENRRVEVKLLVNRGVTGR